MLLSLLLAINLFNYNLNLQTYPGKDPDTLIAFHGMGSSSEIGSIIKTFIPCDPTVISFNFPELQSYGTLDEILPALYVLKKAIVDEKRKNITLYGFSAGGGAIINVLNVLNSNHFDRELEKIGIRNEDKSQILSALKKGVIVLDVPLKSIRELVETRGAYPELVSMQNRYKESAMEPIDVLKTLKMDYTILVYFEKPDQVLGNRDDDLFIDLLKKANLGQTIQLQGSSGGHASAHNALWQYYIAHYCSK